MDDAPDAEPPRDALWFEAYGRAAAAVRERGNVDLGLKVSRFWLNRDGAATPEEHAWGRAAMRASVVEFSLHCGALFALLAWIAGASGRVRTSALALGAVVALRVLAATRNRCDVAFYAYREAYVALLARRYRARLDRGFAVAPEAPEPGAPAAG